MAGIDETKKFIPLRIAVLTVSDTRNLADDRSGASLAERIQSAGHILVDRKIVRDDRREITAVVQTWIGDPTVDVVISTGGTGLTGRDVTPETFHALFEKEIKGFAVVFHQISYRSVGLSTLQSRATAGIARGTFLFALPGSTGAVKDAWDEILRWQLDSRYRPCNLVEIMPRLTEC